MANFTALKTAINNAIKTNGNEEITGAILQAILDAMVETLGDSAINDLENAITTEVTNRENAVGDVAADLAAEALARANKDIQLDNRINREEYNRQNADAALSQTMSQGFQTLGSQMTALNAAISALNAAYQNGYLYGGIATPSSSPSNNKCFYIALQGGTYTNFGGVGVVEGINIIKNDSGWKVEHIYDQTTLLNEFYLLRQQVIQAITSFTPIVIEGDVTNAPDEEDLTSNANHLLQFKNNAYSPLEFSGLGRKYLRKNIAPLSESARFNGFVEGVTAEETLSGTPTQIFWDRMNTRFVGIKDGVYYLDWTDSDNYVPVSTSLVYMYNGTPYQWNGSDFIVDEAEVPNLVNCLTQDMINEANTIYIIRYDYTLKEDITIPANCVLQFDGGSISGMYNLTGANTGINAELVKIFGTDVTFGGTWDILEAYPEWFGAKGNGITDDSLSFKRLFRFLQSCRLTVNNIASEFSICLATNKIYYFSENIEFAVGYLGKYLLFNGNNAFILNAGFTFDSNAGYNLHIKDVKFVNMDSAIIAQRANVEYGDYIFEHCEFKNVSKPFDVNRRSCIIEIKNCYFKNTLCVGDFENVDRLFFHHNWVSVSISTQIDYHSVLRQKTGDEGAMFIYDNLFVPIGGANCKELAWIEVNEHARIYNNRFGGENTNYHPLRIGSGFLPKGNTGSRYPYLSFDHNDEVSGACSIILESLAGNIIIESNQGWLGDFKAIEWSDKLDSEDIATFINNQSSMLNLVVKDNVGRPFIRSINDISLSKVPLIPTELWPLVNRGLHNVTPGNGNEGGICYLTSSANSDSSITITLHNQPFYGVTSTALGTKMMKVCNFKLLLAFGHGPKGNYNFVSYLGILSFDYSGGTLTPKFDFISGEANANIQIKINGESSIDVTTIASTNDITISVETIVSYNIIKNLKAKILDLQSAMDLYV